MPNPLPHVYKPSMTHLTLPLTYSRLYAEDLFLDPVQGLGAFGITRRGFRDLCKALSVPYIEIGNTRLIDALSFSLAMRAILRIGEPSFLAPGCFTLSKGRRPEDTTTSLDTEKLRGDALERVLLELLASKKLALRASTPKIKEAAQAAAARMRQVGILYLPAEEQRNHVTRLLSSADKLDDLP